MPWLSRARRVTLGGALCTGLLACSTSATQGDAGTDVPTDVPTDIPTDVLMDVPTDFPTDVPVSDRVAPRDVPAALDVVTDAVLDAGSDAGIDVSTDVGTEASTDIGTDVVIADGGVVDPVVALGACLGAAAPLTLAGQMPFLSVAVGAQHGAFLVDYGSTFSSIDLAAFAPPGPTTSGCDPSRLGVTCTVAGFAFFAAPSAVYLVTEDFAGGSLGVRQAGIVGTDFTSLRAITLAYRDAQMFAATGGGCSDAALRGAGLTALSSAGFFARDLGSLVAFSTVNATAAGHVPNVPTVPVRVAGVTAVAQLDTGFNDALVPFSVNVNAAFYDAITAADAGALVREAGRDLRLSTCVAGVSEPVEAYAIAAGRSLDFVDTGGAVARSYPGATIFVKRTPAAARTCGGIGTWTAPAAQVAASFFVDMGTLVLDPYTSRVWVPVR